jgi:hypothetical protein
MGVHSGVGDDSGALVSIDTACAPCTAITKDIGDVFVRIGICGRGITTTSLAAGSGVVIVELVVICTDCGFSAVGTELAGTTFALIGTSFVAITTITDSMADRDGNGEDTGVLVSIDTAYASFIAITRDIGAVCELIGICGDAITTTSDLVGSGVAIVASAAISTACAS